jgi:hypothetical protein
VSRPRGIDRRRELDERVAEDVERSLARRIEDAAER